ncbi:LOW QUALITY PROTEIN: hypothetical protein PHMEG_00028544 [Phytophthora megakarya]|uniref:Reverse transcriptase n=1 Tax=Phytophthora megakarya TaxID=4795 RepID=A0A225V5X7_9STRA|nr:LOW QUALITY PROTEIN: hypothetical protein PHMEG_00028544 [Phytophthora megakarya]
MEKRFYFQNGLRAETAKKVKELSPRFLHDVIEITTSFEFVHYGGQSAKVNTGPATLQALNHPSGIRKSRWVGKILQKVVREMSGLRLSLVIILGHIKPQCKATKEIKHYVSGSFYAFLEVSAWASKQSEPPSAVSFFVGNGRSLNGVTEELANQLQRGIIENPDDLMTVRSGYNQTVQRPKPTVEMKLQIPDFPETCETFTVMPVPQGKYIMLGMKWLRENNPDIDWEHVDAVFDVNPHDAEKAEHYKQQRWDALMDNPAYDVLVKYRDKVFGTELPSSTPSVREGIEHEFQLHPGTQAISVKQWRQSPEQRKVIQDWTKEIVQAGIIHLSTSASCAPTFYVKKPVGWRIVHDYRQLTSATILPAIP